MDKELSM